MNSFSFSKHFKWTVALPILIILLAIVVCLSSGGLNLGIDFTGGTMMTIAMGQDFKLDDVKAEFVAQGVTDAVYATSDSGENAQAIIRMRDMNDPDKEAGIREAVEQNLKANYPNAYVYSTERVGAVAGQELVLNAVSAVAIACVLMLAYIWFRFELHFGVTAVVAIALDVAVMISMVGILRLQINSSFIAAILTIVGYAINDTIVIFDRIREDNRRVSKREMTRKEVADRAVRETLPRTINTTITTLLTIVTLYILGVDSIREFALPIIVGLIAGNYTSIFIAPSLWGIWADSQGSEKAAARAKKA